nr:hypothetical protein [Tanacetum cinerariifolium]
GTPRPPAHGSPPLWLRGRWGRVAAPDPGAACPPHWPGEGYRRRCAALFWAALRGLPHQSRRATQPLGYRRKPGLLPDEDS